MEIDIHEYKLECCAKIFGLPFYLICLEFWNGVSSGKWELSLLYHRSQAAHVKMPLAHHHGGEAPLAAEITNF